MWRSTAGTSPSTPTTVRKLIGYMPDHAGVYERVTVREYLEFFADAYRVPTAGTTYAVVDAVMELTDLTKLKDKLVATMSKGMKQRLQLARTLLHDPKVLILDEPASDLDPRARIEIRDLLLELQSMGKTIFLSSHILSELADVCTSVAIIERGNLAAAGPISEISRKLEERAKEAARAAAAAPRPAVPLHAPGYGPPAGPQYPYAPYGPPGYGYPPAPYGAPPRYPPQAPPPPPPTPQAAAPAAAPEEKAAPGVRSAKLRVLCPPEVAAGVLTGVPFVRKVTPMAGGTVLVSYVGDELVLASAVRALVLSQIPVVGVEPERNELERIFLEVTKGEVQ